MKKFLLLPVFVFLTSVVVSAFDQAPRTPYDRDASGNSRCAQTRAARRRTRFDCFRFWG